MIAEDLIEQLDALPNHELLRLHREVCRRAAKIYRPMYREIQEQNYRAAMAVRDTRFVKGLSVMENIKRTARVGGRHV